MSLDLLCVNSIRTLAIDAVQQANSGHPGLPMGAAPMAYALWDRHLKHNPARPEVARPRPVRALRRTWLDVLYSLLYLAGYGLSIDDLAQLPPVGQQDAGSSRVWRGARASR